MINRINRLIKNKDTLTLWMNNLLVVYAFFLPISQSIKAKVFIFIVILFILRGDIKKYIKEALDNSVVRAFIYLFVIYLLGLLWSENLKEALYWLKSVKYGLYLIIFYTIIDGRYIKYVLSGFIFGMLFSEIISYGMMLGILPWEMYFMNVPLYKSYAIGDPSPFLHHIHYGVALSLTVLFLAYQIYTSQASKVIKAMMSLFLLTATTNIFITGGRTGYVTFIILLCIALFFYFRKWMLGTIFVVTTLLLLIYNNSVVFQQKLQQTQKSIDRLFKEEPDLNSSLGIRVGMYKFAYEVIKENPLLGVGTGDSIEEIYKKSPSGWLGREQPHEHNQFLSTFVKVGFIGFLIFLNIYYQIFKYKQEDRELRFIMLFTTLAIGFGILTTQFNLRFFLPLWVVMLSISLISKDRRTIKKQLSQSEVFYSSAFLVLLFSCMHFIMKLS